MTTPDTTYKPGVALPAGRECHLVGDFPNDRVRCLTCHKSFHRAEVLPCVTEEREARLRREQEQ